MKNFLLFTFGLFLIFSKYSFAQQRASDMIDFAIDQHNFGKIEQGTPVYYSFEFENKLNKPVVLENVITSCGCTKPEWSKVPVAPNEKAVIKVGYNAASLGSFNKSIQVILQGTTVPYNLKIKGEVTKAGSQ